MVDQNLICFLVQYSARGKQFIATEMLITTYFIYIATKFLRQLILSWQQWRACLQVSGSSSSCSCTAEFSHHCCMTLEKINCRYFVFFVCLFLINRHFWTVALCNSLFRKKCSTKSMWCLFYSCWHPEQDKSIRRSV